MTYEVSIEQELAATFMGRPHVVLLGAGASKAALPNGDRNGVQVPLLRDIATDLGLVELIPKNLRELAETDFEAAYSQLHEQDVRLTGPINEVVQGYFARLELPDEPNLYDVLTLSLRPKDVVCTFNWDPFLMQSRLRLVRMGVSELPRLQFLHGNVTVGYCPTHQVPGLLGRQCSQCGQLFVPSPLLFPVARKNYQDGGFIEKEWTETRYWLENCFMLSVFGYSAPTTDVEAVALLKEGWGDVEGRNLEQTEIINRPGSDHDQLRETWDRFIHTHHYEIHDSFYDSWIAKHPRRTGEAYWHQNMDAMFISDNPVPRDASSSLEELVVWFDDLRAMERRQSDELSESGEPATRHSDV